MGIKPGKRDIKGSILISGEELDELQKFIHNFCECYGLDNRLSKYKGTRPIGLYMWDFECLIIGIEVSLDDKREYPTKKEPGYHHLLNLYKRVKEVYKDTYGVEYG